MILSKKKPFLNLFSIEAKNKNIVILVITMFLTATCSLLIYNKEGYQTELTLSEEDAKSYAYDVIELIDKEKKNWTILSAKISSNSEALMGARYIWQTKPKNIYQKLINSYIPETYWNIRFVIFKGKPEEKAEEYTIVIDNTGTIKRIQHKISDKKTLPTVSKPAARGLALEAIEKLYQLTPYDLKEISATEKEIKDRTDYTFIFQDLSYINKENNIDARIVICLAGNIITDSYQYIEPPQEWLFKEKKNELVLYYLTIFNVFIFLLSIALLCSTNIEVITSNFFLKKFLHSFSSIFLLAVFYFLNKISSFYFKFSSYQSFEKQRNIILATGIAIITFITLFLTLYTSQIRRFIIINKENSSYKKILFHGFFIGLVISFLIIINDLFVQYNQPQNLTTSVHSYFSEWFNLMSQFLLIFFILSSLFLIVSSFLKNLSKNKQLLLGFSFISTGFNVLIYHHNTPTIISYLFLGPLLSIVLYRLILFLKITNPLVSIPAAAYITSILLIKKVSFSFNFFSIMTILILIIWTFFWIKNTKSYKNTFEK